MPGRLSSLISVTRPSKPSIVSMATRIKGQFPATSLTFKCPFVTFLCCQHLISAGEKEPKVCLNWALCTLFWAASYQITWCFLLINITCCTVFLKLLSSNPHAVLYSSYETFSFKLHFRFVHARKLPRFHCVSSGCCVHTVLFHFFFWSKSQFGPLYGWVRHLDFSFCGCMRVCELQKCACARLLCVNGAATLTLWIVKGPHCRFLHILDHWLNVVMQDPAGTLWKTAPNSVWTVDWKWSLLQLHYHIHDDVITLIKNVWRHGTWKFSHKASTLIMSNKNWARGGGK